MSDEPDRELTALFARTAEDLAPDEFVSALSKRLQAIRRRRLVTAYSLAVVAVAVLAAAAPYIARASLEAADAMASSAGEFGELLISPAGACASVLVGVLIVLRLRARL